MTTNYGERPGMSEQAKHTPGPWRVCDDERNVYAPNTDTAVTNVQHPCAADDAEAAANARLIAAAPDLLAACKAAAGSLSEYLRNEHNVEGAQASFAACIEAIARAEGGAK